MKKLFLFLCSIRTPNLSLNELKEIAKMRRVKGYKSMSKEKLLSALDESESSESEKNIDNARIKQITEELRYKISKSKINEIRKNLYE